MSGHNKWSKIKRKKGVNDARRSKLFTKILKEITIAVKLGGTEPDANPRLRLAIQNAKGANLPKENVERAINKASGNDDTQYTELNYEGYATAGVAVFVEASTDNVNRTYANVKLYFSKCGGSLGSHGSLEFMFDQKGVFEFQVPEGIQNRDKFILELIDVGAEDVEIDDDYVTVTSERGDFGAVQDFLESKKIECDTAGLVRVPKTYAAVDADNLPKVIRLIEMLEDDDDIQQVYHNIELNEETLNILNG